jgi:hypothetical protein
MPTAVIQRVLVIFVIDKGILILAIIFHSNSPLKLFENHQIYHTNNDQQNILIKLKIK